MPTENKIDCPALHKRFGGYPYGDRVPRTVRMLVTVTSDRILGVDPVSTPEAKAGQTYAVWTNSHGAVTAVMGDGKRLGLRPAEFEIDSWHHLAADPAPQPHAEPIAWMVGTAFWWTKEQAERDAAATGLPIVGLGPMSDRAAIELAESETMAAMAELAECEAMAGMVAEREWAEHVGTGDVSSKVEAAFTQLHNDLHEAGDKLAGRDALLQRALRYLSNTPDLIQHGAEDLAQEIRSASAGKPCYGPNEWGTECGQCSKCKSASAEPSAPVAQA